MTGRFTGRHIAGILTAFFAVVITVNFAMAYVAGATFGGLVVDNSYVASQRFNGWLKKARDEQALGWSALIVRTGDHHVHVTLTSGGRPLDAARVTAIVRHPLGAAPERRLRFLPLGEGGYQSEAALPAGRWIVHVRAAAHGEQINRIADLP